MASSSWMAGPMALCCVALAGCGGGKGAPDAAAPTDQCVGSADRAVIASFVPDGGVDAGVDGGVDAGVAVDPVPAWLSGCIEAVDDPCHSVALFGSDAELVECMHTCLASTPLADLSQGCRECYIGTTTCARSECAAVCLGSSPDACVACTMANCTPLFDLCRGL